MRTDTRSRGSRWLRALSLALLWSSAQACGPGAATCPMGSAQLCIRTNDCRCGTICQTTADCTGRDLCVPTTNPNTPGICADPLWALLDAPCVPLCTSNQVCVQWQSMPTACAGRCNTDADCPQRCCVPLADGVNKVCAPERLCQQGCVPGCTAGDICVQFGSRPQCAPTCMGDETCGATCCVALENGGGVCSPGGEFCPTQPAPTCRELSMCVQAQSRFIPMGDGGCGLHGQYEGTVHNVCGEAATCRVCWFDRRTNGYTDCQNLGRLRNNETLPAGDPRCSDSALVEEPFRIRCVDDNSMREGIDCLGQGPL